MSRQVDRLAVAGREGFAELDKMLRGQRYGGPTQGFQPQSQYPIPDYYIYQVRQNKGPVPVITSKDAAKIYGGLEFKEFKEFRGSS